MHRIEQLVSRDEIDDLIERTADDIRRTVRDLGSVAYGWSGGKDSIALQIVCEAAGVDQCVMARTDLEYPAFMAWCEKYAPPGLTVINTGQDLDWLRERPEMLFPRGRYVGEWYRIVQHAAQDRYYREAGLGAIILGRRAADGNYGGPDAVYTNRHGTTRYSPIFHWRHEDVLAACHYYGPPMPPIYSWPRGYRVGTGPWPARQDTFSEQHGWSEVHAIDPGIVRDAARAGFEGAQKFLDRIGA